LLLSGIGKQLNPAEFLFALQQGFGFSEMVSAFIVALVPMLEIVVAVGLLINEFAIVALVAARILFTIFILSHVYSVFAGTFSLGCHCFGELFPITRTQSLLISALCALLSFLPHTTSGLKRNYRRISGRITVKQAVSFTLLIVLLGVSLIVRTSKLKQTADLGLIEQYQVNQEAAVRLEELLLDLQQECPSEFSEATLVLFLKSPRCDQCLDEMRFWNAGGSGLPIREFLAIFPASSTHASADLLTRKFKDKGIWAHGVCIIENKQYEQFLGRRFIGRLLTDGLNIIFTSGGSGTVVERERFVTTVHNLINTERDS
jgi:hypothetical protein